MAAELALFATAARGMEEVLAEEMRLLGGASVEAGRGGVAFAGGLEVAYRACLWSRVASRVLLQLASFQARVPDELYEGGRAVEWETHLASGRTIAVDCTEIEAGIGHTGYAALKLKDAVVDRLRDRRGSRPSVDSRRPDLRIHLHLQADQATVSVDLAGEGLHRRGYRGQGGTAPLRETLAAAVLLLLRWPEVARAGGALLDPMCGSGTLPIEAGLMAADVAPGLARARFGLQGWLGHDQALWQRLLDEARERDRRGRGGLPAVVGQDADPRVVRAARENVERAGLRGLVAIERRELAGADPPPGARPGLVVCNPPYGERLGRPRDLEALYGRLGDTLKQRFAGWTAGVLCGSSELAKHVGLRPARRHVLFNGAIECRLLEIPIHAARARSDERSGPSELSDRDAGADQAKTPAIRAPAEQGEAFANRLRKNLRHLGRWAAREGLSCYRLYDADLPEYALAVDRYERWVHLQEYEPPRTVNPRRAEARLHHALAAVERVLGVAAEDVFLKVRRRQRGGAQYGKLDGSGELRQVREGGHRFLVNLSDYLDTGLFLDQRLTRALLGREARGRHFLNLFGYTAAATVYAARGGARSTTTVDLSNTYLDWARRNLELNGIRGREHRLVRADSLAFVAGEGRRYGLIFLDVPTVSRSKGMERSFEVQRDHAELLLAAARLLEPGGLLVFSNNFRRFRMNAEALPGLRVEDITRRTIPGDFARNPRIHNTWLVTR